jgi:hypothetical protein
VYLGVRPISEFNAVAHAPQELLARLLFHATSGNEFMLTPFKLPEATGNGPRAQAAREKKEQDQRAWMQMVLASQERVDKFLRKLDLLEQASYEVLLENEEKLRKAREELERVRERAYEITMPDGRVVKAYRDGKYTRQTLLRVRPGGG